MNELPLSEYLTVLKRHKKLFLAVTAALFVLSLFFSLRWSNYRSTATVEIEQSEIPSDITTTQGLDVGNMLESLADMRVSRIQQKVTSTGSLVEIITKFNLYPGERAGTPIADLAQNMRRKIKLSLVSSLLANPASAQKATAGQLSAIAFSLSFDYTDPLVTQQVTNEIVSRFLDEDLKQKRSQTEETVAFLAAQIKELEAAMIEQEKKIAEFKSVYGETRPETLMFTQQAVANNATRLQNVESQLASLLGQQDALRAQLTALDPYSRAFADGQIVMSPSLQLKALQTKYAALSAQYGSDHPDVIKTKRQIEALQSQTGTPSNALEIQAKIDDVRSRLAQAQKTYGPENPDVLSLTRQLASLETLSAKQKASGQVDELIKQDADNPAYLQVVAQLRSAQGQYKGLLEEKRSLLAQQEKYGKTVSGNPVAQQQMASLTRDYENAQIRYRELKAKKMAADMNEQMERDRKGQNMVVINPPELPQGTYPSRKLLILAGILLSLGGGIISVAGRQLISQSVCGTGHLTALVGVAPIIAVPHISTQAEIDRLRKLRRMALAALGVIVLAGILFYVTR
ncbi:MAG: hypothetical protein WC654_07615 [Patescibacteria group bacterium]